MLKISRIIPLGAVLVLGLLWPSSSNVAEARCGYPELPFGVQLASVHFENFGYFEEGSKVKVICENGLIGHEHKPTATQASNYTEPDDPEHFMVIDSVDTIECRNSRWNATGMRCLHKVDLDAQNVQVKWKHVEAVRSLDALVDHNAMSCLDIDLGATYLEEHESVLFSIRLDGEQAARIPRVVLMVKSNQATDGHNNITLLEDLILDMNSMANLTDAEGDVEVEEAKRFLDFVYETEFNSVNYTGPVKMMLVNEDSASDRKHKVLRTAHAEARVSVSLGSTADAKLSRDCYFNEDAAIALDRNISTELLIFDCQQPAEGESDKADLIWVRLDIAKLNDRANGSSQTATDATASHSNRSMLQLCGLEAFATVESQTCGKPYVPIYGLVTKTKAADGVSVAQYGCLSGYRAINLTVEQNQLSSHLPDADYGQVLVMQRTCDPVTKKWQPAVEDIFCEPLNSCRHPPPMSDARKYYYEYSKLDNLKRAIGGRSMATLRCLTVTDFVVPFTMFRCDKSGQWVKATNSTMEPNCRSSLLGRNSRRGRPSHYHHHYYHYYQNEAPPNRTAIIIFGRQINDNKYLIYYGAAGLIVLFGGSFIILFHVRRMAKKISRQMRERSYMAAEKGVADHFLPVSAGMDSNLPPYYNGNENFYNDAGTMFSNDLPPPATPISMPTSGLEKGEFKDKNNLSANFDSIKF